MAFTLTENAQRAIEQTNLKPQIVFVIDGYDNVFATGGIYNYIRIGDPNLLIGSINGEPWYIGGFSLIEGQRPWLSLDKGGVAKISQSIDPSKGSGTTVSRMVVPVIDKNAEVSRLISPGYDLQDILGRNCNILLGFDSTAFPQDYISILTGQIESVESGAGLVNFVVVSPEEKKRQMVFAQAKTKLTNAIGTGTIASMAIDNTSGFATRFLGPDGTYDPALSFYIKIEDEILKYDYVSGSNLINVTRGHYGTADVAHGAGEDIDSLIRLEENGIILALKLMLSGWNGPFVEALPTTKFNYQEGATYLTGSIYFLNTNLIATHNVQVGDWITITGAANGANNGTKQIVTIQETNNGSFVTVSETLVDEIDSAAVCSIRSKYDTLGQGARMAPSFVDIERHIELFELFLSSAEMDFIIEEVGNLRDFMDSELYLPMAALSVPRKGRASVGYTIGPIPGVTVEEISSANVTNADKLILKRGISESFMNEVVFKYDYSPVSGEFTSSEFFSDPVSKAEIRVGSRAFTIESRGLTTANQGLAQVTLAADRLLRRYSRGAEYINTIDVLASVGIPVEVGDVVIFDFETLQVTDTTSGTRGGALRLMEIRNKIQDNKNGKVTLNLVDTSFGVNDRYGRISPASYIRAGATTTVLDLNPSFRANVPEGSKWSAYVGAPVVVRSLDYLTTSTSTIQSVTNNTITLATPLSFTPSAGMLMELDIYDNQTEKVKLLFAFLSDGDNDFSDGQPPYLQL